MSLVVDIVVIHHVARRLRSILVVVVVGWWRGSVHVVCRVLRHFRHRPIYLYTTHGWEHVTVVRFVYCFVIV